jgi:hypothetical protein
MYIRSNQQKKAVLYEKQYRYRDAADLREYYKAQRQDSGNSSRRLGGGVLLKLKVKNWQGSPRRIPAV